MVGWSRMWPLRANPSTLRALQPYNLTFASLFIIIISDTANSSARCWRPETKFDQADISWPLANLTRSQQNSHSGCQRAVKSFPYWILQFIDFRSHWILRPLFVAYDVWWYLLAFGPAFACILHDSLRTTHVMASLDPSCEIEKNGRNIYMSPGQLF